ncbi:MAG: glycosyl hydrolase [Nitrospira sp. CG24C]|nr:MAG: glycosyl hydrolase [Nitrospira sp. CG24C]TKB55781.1 MAG: glycosyl hydrolase [Nitrospira sp.]
MPRSRKATSSQRNTGAVALLIGTRKGTFILRGDRTRRTWKLSAPMFLGHIVHHVVLDPRDRRTILMAARTGHLGPTVFRSTDFGKSWKEAKTPPAFPKAPEGQNGRVVDHVFWLTPGHPGEPGLWYAGTSPQGLFRSNDGGVTWKPFSYINDDPQYREWMGSAQDGTPDGPKLHSILIDPRDPKHLYFAMSGGGVHESTDGGRTFAPMINGLETVEGFDAATVTFHDPHCVRLCPTNPDRLYQQNHCGIYRIDRPSNEWMRIGSNMPKKIGDIGFPMVLHPRDANTVWVFPMDGSTVWPRVSPGGKPAAYVTHNGGKTWTRQDKGFPRANAWWTVKRQAMTADAHEAVGLYLGTTSGEVWASRTGGASWTCLVRHLPEIYSLEAAEL